MENKKNSEYPGKGETDMKIIAKIRSDFPTKFGIPRQSGRVEGLTARIVFEPEYRVREAVKGLEDFSHIWLIWEFSEAVREKWSPTVRPPRLGGNERMGVFATRSPFRPNSIGLSCVKLEQIDFKCKEGPVLVVSGADLMDGTPIFDIKPYIPAADCHPEALRICGKSRTAFSEGGDSAKMGGHDPGGEAGSIKGSSQGRSKTSLPERSSEDLRNAFCRDGCLLSGEGRCTFCMRHYRI